VVGGDGSSSIGSSTPSSSSSTSNSRSSSTRLFQANVRASTSVPIIIILLAERYSGLHF